ncbi:MAG: DUF29 family protein [Oscillatoria sp. PMC 1068.18]|nr:DUF29 family protein [Oscillatoria sp. PMC 1076.18]MEC4988244.1 DUF29 family protein [Oscillatoria sp. PMC 1068.18]
MTKKLETQLRQLYEIDYLKWIETTLEKLRSRDYPAIDWDNLEVSPYTSIQVLDPNFLPE